MTGSTRPSEDELIARWFRPLATAAGALGLVDDCAAITPPPGHDLVLKTDAVASGVHFFADDDWGLVAKKALRVNLSDLAAKGARPLGHLLTLALPADWREADLARFAAGLDEDQTAWDCPLLGGDTIRSPDGLIVSITVFGAVPTGRMVRRAAARPGDALFVSGSLGDAALGLILRTDPDRAARWCLAPAERDHLLGRYLLPRPRQPLAAAILAHAGASMDVSDGLGLDLARMCGGSRVAAEVALADLPLSPAAARALAAEPDLIETIVGGGDDYEILAAIRPEAEAAFVAAAAGTSVPVARIGRVVAATDEPAPRFSAADGRLHTFAGRGFRHF